MPRIVRNRRVATGSNRTMNFPGANKTGINVSRRYPDGTVVTMRESPFGGGINVFTTAPNGTVSYRKPTPEEERELRANFATQQQRNLNSPANIRATLEQQRQQARIEQAQQSQQAAQQDVGNFNDVLRSAGQVLAADRQRLGSLSYPAFRGQTIAPISNLTERATTLRNETRTRGMPYAQDIQALLNTNRQGLNSENIQDLTNQLAENQRGTSENTLLRLLQKQFSNSYAPQNAERFLTKNRQDIENFLPEARERLGPLGRTSTELEAARNQQIIRTLRDLQTGEQSRRDYLARSLEQFGGQSQAYANLANQINRNRFQQEVAEPFRRMDLLSQALEPYRTTGVEGLHPDIVRSRANDIIQSMRAYGVDPSRPRTEWTSATGRIEPSRYQGELLAPLPDEIRESYEQLNRLRPNTEELSARRGQLAEGLIANPNLTSRVLNSVPGAMTAQTAQLEAQAKQRAKKDLTALNNQYIRLGQYGSPQHIKAVEARLREVNQAMLDRRNSLLQNTLGEQLQSAHTNDLSSIRQLSQLGQQEQANFANNLNDIINLNRQGSSRFTNRQRELEELYRNYQNEVDWQWPHLRGNIRQVLNQNVIPSGANILQNIPTAISLENLNNLNSAYSDLNRPNTIPTA